MKKKDDLPHDVSGFFEKGDTYRSVVFSLLNEHGCCLSTADAEALVQGLVTEVRTELLAELGKK